MSGGNPASLDGSLLARKGAAAPAISDESPLVLQLDEHRQGSDGPAAEAEDEQQNATAGLVAAASSGLISRITASLASISPSARLMVAGVAAVAVVAILWPSDDSGGTSQVNADRTSSAGPVAEADSPVLKLNLTAAPEAPVNSANSPKPTVTAVAMPASMANAVTEPSKDIAAAVVPAVTRAPAAPASGSIIPANVPSGETSPSVGGVDPSPEIPATIPKSVSPVPIPRAKPELAVAPAGRYAVQLASIPAEKKANAEAFRLQKHLGHVLNGRQIRVEKAVIKGKGTMYRLRANGYRSYAEARAACTQVVQLKSNCLAIRR